MIVMHEPRLVIGSRYTTKHIIRRDTEAGTFEEVNCRMDTLVALHAQRALFKPLPSNLDRLWNQKR